MTTTRKGHVTGQALRTLLITGLTVGMLAACGNGANNNDTDSTGINAMDTVNTLPSDTSTMRDTAPGSEIPPGAINPGEDSARYGTGVQDSSKNRRGGK